MDVNRSKPFTRHVVPDEGASESPDRQNLTTALTASNSMGDESYSETEEAAALLEAVATGGSVSAMELGVSGIQGSVIDSLGRKRPTSYHSKLVRRPAILSSSPPILIEDSASSESGESEDDSCTIFTPVKTESGDLRTSTSNLSGSKSGKQQSTRSRMSLDSLRELTRAAGYASDEDDLDGQPQAVKPAFPIDSGQLFDSEGFAHEYNVSYSGNPRRFELHGELPVFRSRFIPLLPQTTAEIRRDQLIGSSTYSRSKYTPLFHTHGVLKTDVGTQKSRTDRRIRSPLTNVTVVQGRFQLPREQHRCYITNFSLSVPGLKIGFEDENGVRLYPAPLTEAFKRERLLKLAVFGDLNHCKTVNDLQTAFLNSLTVEDLGENRLMQSKSVRNLVACLAQCFNNSEAEEDRIEGAAADVDALNRDYCNVVCTDDSLGMFETINRLLFDPYEQVDVPATGDAANSILGSIEAIAPIIAPEVSDDDKLHLNVALQIWMSGFNGFAKINPERFKILFQQCWSRLFPGESPPVVVLSFGRRDGDPLVQRLQSVDSVEYLKSHPSAKSKFSKASIQSFAAISASPEFLSASDDNRHFLIDELQRKHNVVIEAPAITEPPATYFPTGADPHARLLTYRPPSENTAAPAPAKGQWIQKRSYRQMQGAGNAGKAPNFFVNKKRKF